MRRGLPLLAWLTVLALLALTLLREPGLGRARDDVQQVLAVELERSVDYPLDPGEEAARVVTWAARPASWARDVRTTVAYALELEVLDAAGQVAWSGLVWHRARQSWRLGPGDALLRPSWLPSSREELTDTRVVDVDLAGRVPDGGRLRLRARHAPPGVRVLGIAYRHALRTRAARLRYLAGGSPDAAAATARALGATAWEALPQDWRLRLSERVWERLGPLPAPGAGRLRTVELLHSRPEVPWESQSALGLPVPPGGAVAFNLLEGATLTARWRDAGGRRAASAPTWLQLVHHDGTSEVRFLGVVEEIGPVRVDGPLQSVQLALDPGTDGARVLQARLEGSDETRAWGDPSRDPVVEQEGAPPVAWRLAPDLRTLEAIRLGPGLTAVRYRVDDARETLRVALRPRLPGGPLHGFGLRWDPASGATVEAPPTAEAPRTVRIVALDPAGRELARWETQVEARPSAFERYTQGDDPGSARAGEPEQRYLLPPAGTAWIELSADGDVDVAVRARRPGHPPARVARGYAPPDALRPPPDDQPSPLPAWQVRGERDATDLPLARYEPYAQDPWRARAPEDAEALLAEGRVIRLDAQVRLDPQAQWVAEAWVARDRDEEAVEAEPLPTVPEVPARGALPLDGPFTLLAEPDRDGNARAGARTRLSEATATLTVPRSGRLDVDYRVDARQAGQEVHIELGGQVLVERLWATAGQLRLLGLPAGQRLTVRLDQPGLFLAHARGSPAWQVRRVVRLQPGQRRVVLIPGGPGSLAIYAYGEGGWLDWSLHGGAPSAEPALLDRVSRRSGRHALRSEGGAAWPVSTGGAPVGRLSALVVNVGADLGAAPAQLELELTGAEAPVWIRAAATWTACPGPGCAAPAPSRATVGSR